MAATPRQIYLNQKEGNLRILSHIGDVYEGFIAYILVVLNYRKYNMWR